MLEVEVRVGAVGAGEPLATDPGLLEGPTEQTPRVPRHQRRLPTGMTEAGESLREPWGRRGVGGPSI